ncbi:MAG: mechanosensitive ion channel domain-containing protein [Planctomycetota bacterium]
MQDATPPTDTDVEPSATPAIEPANELPDVLNSPPIEQVDTWIDGIIEYFKNEEIRTAMFEAVAQRLILIFILLIAAIVVIRIVNKVLSGVQVARGVPEAAVLPIRKLVRGLILLLVALVTLQLLGVPMTAVWATVSAVVGLVAIGFVAVWSVLSNIACSIMLILFKPFRIGDHIELVDSAGGPNVTGRVSDLTLMYVILHEKLEDGTEQLVQIPNNLFFQKLVRRRSGKASVALEDHIDKHGFEAVEERAPAG